MGMEWWKSKNRETLWRHNTFKSVNPCWRSKQHIEPLECAEQAGRRLEASSSRGLVSTGLWAFTQEGRQSRVSLLSLNPAKADGWVSSFGRPLRSWCGSKLRAIVPARNTIRTPHTRTTVRWYRWDSYVAVLSNDEEVVRSCRGLGVCLLLGTAGLAPSLSRCRADVDDFRGSMARKGVMPPEWLSSTGGLSTLFLSQWVARDVELVRGRNSSQGWWCDVDRTVQGGQRRWFRAQAAASPVLGCSIADLTTRVLGASRGSGCRYVLFCGRGDTVDLEFRLVVALAPSQALARQIPKLHFQVPGASNVHNHLNPSPMTRSPWSRQCGLHSQARPMSTRGPFARVHLPCRSVHGCPLWLSLAPTTNMSRSIRSPRSKNRAGTSLCGSRVPVHPTKHHLVSRSGSPVTWDMGLQTCSGKVCDGRIRWLLFVALAPTSIGGSGSKQSRATRSSWNSDPHFTRRTCVAPPGKGVDGREPLEHALSVVNGACVQHTHIQFSHLAHPRNGSPRLEAVEPSKVSLISKKLPRLVSCLDPRQDPYMFHQANLREQRLGLPPTDCSVDRCSICLLHYFLAC